MTTISDRARRLRHRLDAGPRLPFMIVVAAAALVLLGALDWRPVVVDVEREVDEIELPDEFEDLGAATQTTDSGDIEIIEYGFGVITDPDGDAVYAVGVHVRNPYDSASIQGALAVEVTDANGDSEAVSRFELGMIEPGGERRLSGVIPKRRLDPTDMDGSELAVAPEEISRIFHSDGVDPYSLWTRPELPSLEIVGVDELYAPQGVRVECRIDVEEALTSHWAVYVFFRDSDGTIVGGIPFDRADRHSQLTRVSGNSTLLLPRGASTRYLDLTYDEIPAEADLDMIEIGFSRW